MKVLCVIDMQKDFVDGSLGTKEAEAIVDNVVNKVKEYRELGSNEKTGIFFTLDTHDETYMNTEEGKNLPVEHCIKGTDGWKLFAGVGDIASEIQGGKNAKFETAVVEKVTFGSVDLPEIVKKTAAKLGEDIEEIELVGLCTDVCVISNALMLKANFPNIPIFVDAACCAGVTPAGHDTALAAMESCQIHMRNKGSEPWR